MDLSGDEIQTVNDVNIPSVRYSVDIWVTNSGLVSEEPTDHFIRGVTQVMDGQLGQVLHLIGYSTHELRDKGLITEDTLSATDTVMRTLSKMKRFPSSGLLVHNNQIFGAIVDNENKCRVIGRVVSVVPDTDTDSEANTLFVSKDISSTTRRSKNDFDLKAIVSNGGIFGLVSAGGFAAFQTDVTSDQQMSHMILVANKGYFVVENTKVDWIRHQIGLRINQFAIKRTALLPNETLITNSGVFCRSDDGFVVYGSGNAVVSFSPFMDMMSAMKTVGFKRQTEDQNEEPIAQSEEPLVKNEEPMVQSEEPMVQSEEPMAQSEEPLVKSKELMVQNEEPLIQREEPLVQSEEPLFKSEESLIQSEEPLVKSEEPMAQSEEPLVQSEEPIVPNVEPIVQSLESIRQSEEPMNQSVELDFECVEREDQISFTSTSMTSIEVIDLCDSSDEDMSRDSVS